MRRKVREPKRGKWEARRSRVARRLAVADRPKLTVYRSSRHIYAQLIDDMSGKTLASASTRSKDVRGGLDGLKKKEAAQKVGTKIAESAKAAGINTIVFDRRGWPFHGRIAALADAAREAGLKF